MAVFFLSNTEHRTPEAPWLGLRHRLRAKSRSAAIRGRQTMGKKGRNSQKGPARQRICLARYPRLMIRALRLL